jgi:hypothetical protein
MVLSSLLDQVKTGIIIITGLVLSFACNRISELKEKWSASTCQSSSRCPASLSITIECDRRCRRLDGKDDNVRTLVLELNRRQSP